jgi:hypothetical protein
MLADKIGPIGVEPRTWALAVVVVLGFGALCGLAGFAAGRLDREQRRADRADEQRRTQLAAALRVGATEPPPLPPPAEPVGAHHPADNVDLPDDTCQVIELDGPTVNVADEWWYRPLLRRTGRAGGA